MSEEAGPAQELTNLLVGEDPSEAITLGNASDLGAVILLASFFDRTSAAYFAPLEFGHGPVVIEAQILVSSNRASPPPGMGWALVVMEEGSGSLLGGGGIRLGVPSGFDGYAVEWRFDNGTVERDTVALNRVDAANPTLVRIGTLHNISSPPGVDADTNEVTQRIRVTLRADEPTTSVDETRIEMEVLDNNGITTRTTCTASDCGHRLVRGGRYHIGATAATSSTRDADILISQVSATRGDVCP